MRWVTAQDLQSWAGRLDAESRLPELVRRLVHATLDAPDRVAFPSGESVQTGGWDGIVLTSAGNEYVPQGSSGWELSKRADIRAKADEDYEKRTADPEHLDRTNTTFVFVTPRRWNSKEQWAAEKDAAGIWAAVRAYDADDLEQWLERSPAVGAWLARLLQKYPAGVLSSDDVWAEYSFGTAPPFTSEILFAGRAADAKAAAQWLNNGTGTCKIAADSPREAFALLAASVTLLGPDEQEVVRSRFLLADDPVVLRELLTTGNHLIIGWLATDTTSVGLALQQGHRVILHARADQQPTLRVSRPDSEALLAALKNAGVPENQAGILVRESGGSITVLHRRLSTAPAPPLWAAPEHARELLSGVLASAWDEQRENDKAIVAALAGGAYAGVSATMARWSHVPDAPVQQVGTIWAMRAPRDAWHLLHAHLTQDDIDRFTTALTNVLGVADPSLELPAPERWLANIHGKELPHSSWLRRGLSQTVILISLTPTIVGHRGADVAASIVHDTLSAGWQRWYALEPVLPLLAEAAPAAFLTALEAALANDPDGFDNLFVEIGPMHGDHATGLLWSLELLAWYPEHLTRAALLLADLARKHKRPPQILRAIFLTWHPQTGANVQDRTTALTLLLQREPTVGWVLLLELWPKHHDVGSHHYEPQWRDRPPTAPVTVAEHVKGATAIVDLALASVGGDSQRLADVITHMDTMPPNARARLRDQLTAFANDEHEPTPRLRVWSALREQTNKHRHFHDAEWALAEEDVALFDPIAALLTPEDVISRHAWLFQDGYPMLPEPGFDHIAVDAALRQRRTKAATEILAERGVAGLSALATNVEYPYLVGSASAAANAAEAGMLAMLNGEDERVRLCGMGYASERHRHDGLAWVDGILADHHDWSPTARAALLLAMPSERITWDRVEQQDVEQEYWSRTRVFLERDPTPEDIAYAITHLLAANQVPQAFEEASMYAQHAPTPVLTQTLDRVLQALQDPEPRTGHLTGYHIVQILNALDARQDVDGAAIARYEWAYLPLLRHERHLRLHDHLASAPDLFAQMIASIYRADNEEAHAEPTAQEKARASQAYELLSSWHTVPGTTADGTIDQEPLFAWTAEARAACEGRQGACDDQIGKVLAWAPAGADGVWPHESVRALIEHLHSRVLEDGFSAGVINKRGAFTRDPFEGGVQERALATRYRGWAQAVAAASPRTAAVLAQIGEDYERSAHHEDVRAQQLRLRH